MTKVPDSIAEELCNMLIEILKYFKTGVYQLYEFNRV